MRLMIPKKCDQYRFIHLFKILQHILQSIVRHLYQRKILLCLRLQAYISQFNRICKFIIPVIICTMILHGHIEQTK